ncbi:MAG: helix-hairpin-helix domain-containing protein [Bacteroidales bacterium]|nr:helix-hairpin-helix domain-containing protein [Bacteroidales bacterium]
MFEKGDILKSSERNFANVLKVLLVSFLLIISNATFSQNENSNTVFIEELIEEITENSEEDIDFTTLFEDLNFFLENPINLNKTNYETLSKLHLLSEFQIKAILNYVEKDGPMLTIYELQLVMGFSKEIIFKLLPFVTVEKAEEKQNFALNKALKYGKNQIYLRTGRVLENQQGFSSISDSAIAASPNSRYLGNPWKHYARYRYYYKNSLFFGITAEKDAGEEFFRGTQKNGFDYYSAHLQLNNVGIIKTLCLGDFQAQFGQGLTLWSGMSFGKSPYILNVNKKAGGIKRYTSTNENLFFRGGGTTLRYKDFDLSLFVSKKKIDANITSLDTINEEVLEVSSFQITGLHTTPNEIEDKNAIGEFVYGANLDFSRKFYKIGGSFVAYEFDSKLQDPSEVYKQYNFNGLSNFNSGVHYQIFYKNLNLFGEAAYSENGSTAYINGAVISVSSQVSFVALHRNYQKDYQGLYSNGFSENTQTYNEEGLYIGTVINPIKYWKISAYYDSYSFPWLKFRVNAPSGGDDYFAQIDFTPSRRLSMYWKYKQETKPQNETIEDGVYIAELDDVTTTKYRYHIAYSINKEIEFRNRLELINYKKENSLSENGYMIYHDIVYRPQAYPMAVSVRYAIFDTEGWNSRIYAYESDVLYAFSIPAYYSKGTRFYVNLKYSPSKKIDIYIKYSRTYFSDMSSIGSGLTLIEGNKRSEFRTQIRLRF